MQTKQYDLLQHGNDLSELLAQITSDTEIEITRGGTPIARLVPSPSVQRRPGLHPGAFLVRDDFDAPLLDTFWLGEN